MPSSFPAGEYVRFLSVRPRSISTNFRINQEVASRQLRVNTQDWKADTASGKVNMRLAFCRFGQNASQPVPTRDRPRESLIEKSICANACIRYGWGGRTGFSPRPQSRSEAFSSGFNVHHPPHRGRPFSGIADDLHTSAIEHLIRGAGSKDDLHIIDPVNFRAEDRHHKDVSEFPDSLS